MQYKLIINKIENKKIKDVNISKMSEPLAVMRQLAICYRESNKSTRKNEKITKARVYETFTEDGLKAQRFYIEIKYDDLNIYIYDYTFTGCGLD